MFGDLGEYFPILKWWRQGRNKLELLPSHQGAFEGKTVLITGGSGAVCGAAAATIFDLGAEKIVLAVPDIPEEEGEEKTAKLERVFEKERLAAKPDVVVVWKLDLLSFAATAAFAERVDRELDRLDCALLGAGAIFLERKFTADGWERSLQIIHLSSALLTIILLPILRRSAEKHGTHGVLTSVTSLSARLAGASFPFPPLAGKTQLETISIGAGARSEQSLMYATSKLTHLAWLHELTRRMGERTSSADNLVLIHAVDFCVSAPGTGLTAVDSRASLFTWLFGRPVEICALAIVNACIRHPGTHGKIFIDYEPEAYPAFLGRDWAQLMERSIWEETERILCDVSPTVKNALAKLT